MRKITLAVAMVAALAFAVPAVGAGVHVLDPTPNSAFSEGADKGYVEVSDHGVEACNENPNTPAGENLTGSAWINSNGNGNGSTVAPTYGNGTIGAGDNDGETDADPANGTENNDCGAPEGTKVGP